MTPIAQEIRVRIDKWDCIKTRSFCTVKETINKVKRQSMQWETISARYSSDRGLILRIYNKIKKLNTKRINNTISKWANELKRHFSNEEVQIVNKGVKNFSTNLAIKEMQIKTTLRFYLPIQKTIIKKTNNSKCCQGCRSGRTVEGRNSYSLLVRV
jgi:hypothetical protein